MIIFTQLYTEHYHLNQYLYRFNIIEIPEYKCDREKGIIEYYLLNYELYDEKRDALRRKVEV